MNYRELLKKYMKCVGDNEGSLFLEDFLSPKWTQEEWDALWEIIRELDAPEASTSG